MRHNGEMSTWPTLVGTSVRLIPLAESQTEQLLRAANEDRRSYAFTFVPRTSNEVQRYIEVALAERDNGLSLPFAIERIDEGRLVGSTRFLDIDYWIPRQSPADSPAPSLDRDAPRAVEIGATWLAASAQRTSINTESKLLLLQFAFESWKVERVSFKTDERNRRSREAIARLGAVFEGVRRAHMLAPDGTVRNSAYFSILRDDWPRARETLVARLGEPDQIRR